MKPAKDLQLIHNILRSTLEVPVCGNSHLGWLRGSTAHGSLLDSTYFDIPELNKIKTDKQLSAQA